MLVDYNGCLKHVYRKHFLYITDMSWAKSGQGFQVIDIENIGKVNKNLKLGWNRYMYGFKL